MNSAIDWRQLFVPTSSLLELFIRGSLMYLLILAGFRIFRRDPGSLSVSDLLVVVLIADAAQNGMAGEYKSVTEGVVIVATIFAWNYALDWASYRFPVLRRLVEAPPLVLVRHGRVLRANLRKEMLTIDDLLAKLREQGVEDLHQVKAAFMESDGMISVVRADGAKNQGPEFSHADAFTHVVARQHFGDRPCGDRASLLEHHHCCCESQHFVERVADIQNGHVVFVAQDFDVRQHLGLARRIQ